MKSLIIRYCVSLMVSYIPFPSDDQCPSPSPHWRYETYNTTVQAMTKPVKRKQIDDCGCGWVWYVVYRLLLGYAANQKPFRSLPAFSREIKILRLHLFLQQARQLPIVLIVSTQLMDLTWPDSESQRLNVEIKPASAGCKLHTARKL